MTADRGRRIAAVVLAAVLAGVGATAGECSAGSGPAGDPCASEQRAWQKASERVRRAEAPPSELARADRKLRDCRNRN